MGEVGGGPTGSYYTSLDWCQSRKLNYRGCLYPLGIPYGNPPESGSAAGHSGLAAPVLRGSNSSPKEVRM